jgi:photosystem II stability/assembly factor-like uncharacterized protein
MGARGLAVVGFLLFSEFLFGGRGVWTRVGPVGGEITCMAVAPSNPNVVYAGTGTGRVFRSVDAGRSWDLASRGIGIFNPYRISSAAVDPNSPSTAYVAGDRAFKTTDGGAHWAPLSGLPVNLSFSDWIVTDPVVSGMVYIATGDELFKSVDGGTTWERLRGGLSEAGVQRVAVSASQPSRVYALAFIGLYRSDDGGEHWAATTLAHSDGISLVVDPTDPDVVYADRQRSRDGGATWMTNDSFAVATAINDDGSVVFGTNFGASLFASTDGGASWHVLAKGPPEEVIEALAVSNSFLLAGFQREGIFRSVDGGRSWTESNSGLTAVSTSCLAVSRAAAPRAWVGTTDGRILRSDDDGRQWSETDLSDDSITAVAADPVFPDTAYALTIPHPDSPNPYNYYGDARRTTDAGQTWTATGTFFWNYLVADPRTSGVLYATGPQDQRGYFLAIFKSVDGGLSWDSRGAAAGPEGPGVIAVDPITPSRVYVADYLFSSSSSSSRVWRSDDAGNSWQQPVESIDDASLSELVVGRDAEPTILAVGSKGVWRSSDLGSRWELTTGVPTVPSVFGYIQVVEDGRSPGTFFASAGGSLFVSADAGESWLPFTEPGFPEEPVLQLAASTSGDLFARTKAGIFTLRLVSILPATHSLPPAGGGRK